VASGRKRFNYTNDQLSQIYKDCIEKAQRGKINQQNAWNLHLVDNIKEITTLRPGAAGGGSGRSQRDQNAASADTNEFARASHTIDAASKIYGYRVDSVHTKMYTVLNSIHQQSGDPSNPADVDLNGDGGNAQRRRARNRNVGRATLCEPDKVYKLNETMKNLCVEVDALFHKTASCFDEGGAKGLLMNTLYVQNGCDIVFDSTTMMEQNEDITNHGVQVDVTTVEDPEQIEREQQWMSQLATSSFGKEVSAFDGFTQVDVTSDDFDVSTQTKPQHFAVDLDWMQRSGVCPLLDVFQKNIEAIANHLPGDWSSVGRGRDRTSSVHGQAHDTMSPEKDLHQPAAHGFGDIGDAFADDNDIMMEMPDFTIGGGDDLNAQDLFHEELLTQAAAPAVGGQQSLMLVQQAQGAMNMRDLSNLQLDPNHLNAANLSAANLEYVVGQNNQNIVGNIGVQPALNVSWVDDDEQVLSRLNQEQQNEQYAQLHRGGIYKRGAMNLRAMNAVISKLENADFESLTSFFDTKKHGNWAGPDQWYHRRYQLTLQSQKHSQRSQSPNKSASVQPHGVGGEEEKSGPSRPRRERQSKLIDFMSIAGGQLIEEKEFEEPQRSYNTLTQGVLDRNRKGYHTLPKDLQIKPDLFIKLFHRPNYSVWKHWLNQHKLRMMKRRNEAGDGDGAVLGQRAHDGSAVGVHFADDVAGGSMLDGGAMGMDVDAMDRSQVMAMEQMAQFEAGNDDDDEFQYDYGNPMDTSHFVPNLGGDGGDDEEAQFDFNLNGYDLIEADPDRKVERIEVEYAVTAKKVNVRKLKLKLWDRIDVDIVAAGKEKENESRLSNKASSEEDDDDIEMGQRGGAQKGDKAVTFQDSLSSLPANISSAISVQMCFICLLHLANEKELQFVQTESKKDKGDFVIQYADANSKFERDANATTSVMIL